MFFERSPHEISPSEKTGVAESLSPRHARLQFYYGINSGQIKKVGQHQRTDFCRTVLSCLVLTYSCTSVPAFTPVLQGECSCHTKGIFSS